MEKVNKLSKDELATLYKLTMFNRSLNPIDGDGIDDRDQRGPGMPNMSETLRTKMQSPITAQLLSGQANTPASAMAAFNQMQPMSTQQLSFSPQQPLSQAPGGLAQFSSMLNRFS